MVKDEAVPDDGETENTQPVAVPEFKKSSAVSVDASMVAEKDSEYDKDELFDSAPVEVENEETPKPT
jgi:hypothetical protein